MRFVLRLLLLALLALGGTAGYMLANESDYIFFPEPEMTASPHSVGLPFSTQHITTPDGSELLGWYMPSRKARFVVLHMHGNAGNISNRNAQYRRWHDMGLSVFAFDYRGYGGSTGVPSEAGLDTDAMAAWKLLTETYDIPPERIIIAGRSLGSAVAARLASELSATTPPAGLVLEVPFTSVPDMSADQYPWLPLRWFVKNRFDTAASLASLKLPLLLISAKQDELIPAWMPDKLFDAYAGPKLRGNLDGEHNDFDSTSEGAYIRLWEIWLDSLPEAEQDAQQWVRSIPALPAGSFARVRGEPEGPCFAPAT